MGKVRVVSAIAGVAMTAAFVGSSTASAATLIGDYQFQGTRASSGPGPDLTELAGANGPGAYQSESVMGTTRQVLAFPQGTGLQMSPTGLTSANHSVVMTFRLVEDTGYNRILDWSHGTLDNGIYDNDRYANYYRPTGQGVTSDNAVFGSNTYSTLAVTMGNTLGTRLFVNGTNVVESPYQETIIGDAIRFFYDNTSGGTPGEESAGAVSCIRVYSDILTDAEIAGIGASATCQAPPAQPQPQPAPAPPVKKKCKKHKKKHRSAESAKKKCKKHKKR